MSELQWQPSPSGHRYSIHAGEYSVCKIGSAHGWKYECWIGRRQVIVGLRTAEEARVWCQRHHDTHEGKLDADDQQTPMPVGQEILR